MTVSVVLLYFIGYQVKLELNLDEISKKSPFLTVVLSDFNAKSQTWFKNDKTSYEGSKLDILHAVMDCIS